MKGTRPEEIDSDEIRPLRRSEMEFLKGGAQPGPSAVPPPPPPPTPRPLARPKDRRSRR